MGQVNLVPTIEQIDSPNMHTLGYDDFIIVIQFFDLKCNLSFQQGRSAGIFGETFIIIIMHYALQQATAWKIK